MSDGGFSISGLRWQVNVSVRLPFAPKFHAEGPCYCMSCQPEIYEWVKSFADHEGYVCANEPAGRLTRAWFNDVEVSDRCYIAVSGEEGLVVLYADPDQAGGRTHICGRCGMRACMRVWTGKVRVAIYPSKEALERSKVTA